MEADGQPELKQVLREHLAVFVPLLLLLPATYLLPPIAVDPRLHDLALAAYWVSESGGKLGIPFVGAIALAAVLVRLRAELGPIGKRLQEAAIITLSLGLVLGTVAALNEHVVKPAFSVPRPNVKSLCQGGRYSLLGKTSDEFYALPDKEARSAYFQERVTAGALDEVRIPERILAHWVRETGFSFPSGHSMASMTFASYFFALALSLVRGRRRWAFAIFPLWALAVCASRPLLFVHSWIDVSVGGLVGALVGLASFMLARSLLGKLSDSVPDPGLAPAP